MASRIYIPSALRVRTLFQSYVVERFDMNKLRAFSMGGMCCLAMASPVLHDSESSQIPWYCNVMATFGTIAVVVSTHPEEMKKYYHHRPWARLVIFMDNADVNRFAVPLCLPTLALSSMVAFATRVPPWQLIPWIPFYVAIYLLLFLCYVPILLSLIWDIREPPEKLSNSRQPSATLHDVLQEEPGFQMVEKDYRKPSPGVYHGLQFMGPSSSAPSTKASDIDLEDGTELAKFVARRCPCLHDDNDDFRISKIIPMNSRTYDFPDFSQNSPEVAESLMGEGYSSNSVQAFMESYLD